jgi:hypothetical protein
VTTHVPAGQETTQSCAHVTAHIPPEQERLAVPEGESSVCLQDPPSHASVHVLALQR